MKKTVLVFLLNLFGISIHAQNPAWVRGISGSGIEAGVVVTADASGNVYTMGDFQGTADFDPSPGVFNLTSNGGYDIFVTKFDSQGNFVWAVAVGGTNNDYGTGFGVDGSGMISVNGYFSGTVDFDPGAGIFNLTATGPTDVFVLRLDAGASLAWAVRFGGAATIQATDLAVDASGNVYSTGYFISTMDFDPGPGFSTLQAFGADIFISKLDNNGNFVWARRLGGSATEVPLSISIDPYGYIYTTGYFTSATADFDPGPGTFNLTTAGFIPNGFISKLNAAGNFVWADGLIGPGNCQVSDVDFDAAGDVIITGAYTNAIDFDPGPGTDINNTQPGAFDAFVSKLDTMGTRLWTSHVTGTGTTVATKLGVDAAGNIFTTGRFNTTADFDPGAATTNLNSNGNYDLFVFGLNSSGNFMWANSAGDLLDENGGSLAVDNFGNLYITGTYLGNVNFSASVPNMTLVSTGGSFDAFVLKYGTCSGMITLQPANKILPVNTSAQFMVASPTASFQWQQDAGSGYADLANGGQYLGVNTATLIVSGVSLAQDGYKFRCVITNGNCSATSDPALLTVYNDVGIRELNRQQAFAAYPNPAAGTVQLEADPALAGSAFSISDQTGRLLLSGKLNGGTASVDISCLPTGLYFLKVAGSEQKPLKLVKQ